MTRGPPSAPSIAVSATGRRAGDYRLIAITDDLRDGREGLVARATAATRGGATMVQLRLKAADARTLTDIGRAMVAALTVPVIINDRLDVALACGAAGVHIACGRLAGRAGARARATRLSDRRISGKRSRSGSRHGRRLCRRCPVFGSSSKLDAGEAIGLAGLRQLTALAGLPAVAIGGITADTIPGVLSAGVVGVAVIGAIFGGPDPEAAARSLRAALDQASGSRG